MANSKDSPFEDINELLDDVDEQIRKAEEASKQQEGQDDD